MKVQECSANSPNSVGNAENAPCFQSRGIVFYTYLFIVFTSYTQSLAPTQEVKTIITCIS